MQTVLATQNNSQQKPGANTDHYHSIMPQALPPTKIKNLPCLVICATLVITNPHFFLCVHSILKSLGRWRWSFIFSVSILCRSVSILCRYVWECHHRMALYGAAGSRSSAEKARCTPCRPLVHGPGLTGNSSAGPEGPVCTKIR